MEKEEKETKEETQKTTRAKRVKKVEEPIVVEEVIKEAKVVENNKCVKCGAEIPKKDEFCYKCGWKQSDPVPVVKPKQKSNFSVFRFFIVLVLILLFFIAALSIWRYFQSTENNINYGNRNVTIDDTGIADAVEKVYDSVVVVENYVNEKLYATGSGFVYKTDNAYGYILTNSHVINGATEVAVRFTNKEKAKAEVLGNDEFSDVAVLKVPKKNITQVAVLGDNSKMRVGDTTFAVGTPLDSKTYSWSVTRGVLSGKDRLVSSGTSYMNVLQTDTPINSGNSGGPLCNANGEVIGITNMKLASDQIEGMGFAIPIETAIQYANGFMKGETVDRPYIGVSIYDASKSFFSSETNVMVDSVEANSPADEAGIRKGDIILKVNGEVIENSSHFKYKLYEHKVGEKVDITIKRDDKEMTFKVKLGSNSRSKA